MSAEINPLEEYEWIGEFYQAEKKDIKYSGILSYSPSLGIKLTLMWDFNKSQEFFHSEKDYFNFLGDTHQLNGVSLIGCRKTNSYCNFGKQNKADFIVPYAILNAHITSTEEKVLGIYFSFNNFENFCSHFTEKQIFYKAPLMHHKIDGNVYEIKNTLKNGFSLSEVLFPNNRNKTLINSIKKMVEKKDLYISEFNPYFFIKLAKKQTFWHTMKLKFLIEKLFSIFFLSQINSNNVFLKIKNGRNIKSCRVLFDVSKYKDKPRTQNYHFLPINLNNVKERFPDILTLWQKLTKDEFNIINLVLTDKLYERTEVGYQSYVLYMAFIEEWQVKYGIDKSENGRFKRFFQENISNEDDFIYEKLFFYFPKAKNIADIAKNIADIRDCIVHTDNKRKNDKRYKLHKHILEDEISIRNLCEILFLLFIRCIYNRMGINLTEHQKDNFKRQLISWNTVPC